MSRSQGRRREDRDFAFGVSFPAGQDAADGGVGLLRTPRHVPRYGSLTEPCQSVHWMAFPQIASVPQSAMVTEEAAAICGSSLRGAGALPAIAHGACPRSGAFGDMRFVPYAESRIIKLPASFRPPKLSSGGNVVILHHRSH